MAAEWAQNSWLLKRYPAVRGHPGMLQGCVMNEPINKQMQIQLKMEEELENQQMLPVFFFISAAE